MNIQPLHPDFILPTRGTEHSAGYDIYMPTSGMILEGPDRVTKVPLGFATAIPLGFVALILPRSGVGAKFGVELNNTCGVIDSDYRGEWIANIRTKSEEAFGWAAGEKLLQFILVPVGTFELNVVETLEATQRGAGGFGHTGG